VTCFLREHGELDPDNLGHQLVAASRPLSAAEHQEHMAIGEVLARYYRHPSMLDHAVPETRCGRGAGSPARGREARQRDAAYARAIADLTGALVNPDPVYLQSAGFVLDPAGKVVVVVSVYSSGAIGGLVPDDDAGLVRYVREQVATSA